jgi:hypothetical protein
MVLHQREFADQAQRLGYQSDPGGNRRAPAGKDHRRAAQQEPTGVRS